MHRLSPADELSEIRAEIARLKAREAVLRAGFLRDPDAGAVGRWARVEVSQNRIMAFDPCLMPDHLRYNANFMREKLVQTVRCLPLAMTPARRPGWPIQREATVVSLH